MVRVSLPGAFLLGLSTFQAEFDFGVPQFRMVFGPMLIMLAAGVSLVAARVWLGRGRGDRRGAVLAGDARADGAARRAGAGRAAAALPALRGRGAAGRGRSRCSCAGRCRSRWSAASRSGTVGLAAEWGWTHVWMVLPWPAALFPEGFVLGLAMAIAGCLVGAWLGARLAADRQPSLRCGARGGRGGDLRAGRLRAALDRLAGRARDGRADARRAGPGQRRRCASTPRRRRRRRRVADRHRVAGRRAGRRPPASASSEGVYRTTAAGAGHRRLEDDDPPAPRQRADRAADLPARRPGDPGQGHPGAARGSSAPSGPSRSCSSASARRTRRAGCGASPTASCWRSRWSFLVVAGVGRAPRLVRGGGARRSLLT